MRGYERIGVAVAVASLATPALAVAELSAGGTFRFVRLLLASSAPMGVAVALLLTASAWIALALVVRTSVWPLLGVLAVLVVAATACAARYGHLHAALVPAALAYVVLLTATAVMASVRRLCVSPRS